MDPIPDTGRDVTSDPSPGAPPDSSPDSPPDVQPDVQPDVPATLTSLDAAACPACGVAVALPEGVVTGEVVFCEHCGVELELISCSPAILEFFEEEEK